MANINTSSIMDKVKAYSRSVNGKLRMRECIQRYAKEGKETTEAGGKILTEENMYKAAAKFIQVLRSTAQSYDLPASIMRHFDSLDASSIIKMPDGSAVIYVYFGGDLHRDSLYSEGYDGVDNIIAVLNNGYHARDYVYGDWEGHSPTGESKFDNRSIAASAFIRSRKDREGLHFIQQALQDFNSNYGSEYNVTAVAGDEYN